MTKEQLIERALALSGLSNDFWANLAEMVKDKPGIGIADRGAYTQREWNWLQQGKASLRQPWD